MDVCIVIPALNEALGISSVIEELRALGYDDILIVDGGSKDDTREIARSLGARVILEKRKGYGRAYKTGFENADANIIATMDGDGTYPVEAIPGLVSKLIDEELDFITTNRFAELEEGAMNPLHAIGNLVLNLEFLLLFKKFIKDSQSGMWIFRRDVLKKFNMISDGMGFSEEIKGEACRKCRIKEVGIKYRQRVGEKKLSSFKDGIDNFLFMLEKRLKYE